MKSIHLLFITVLAMFAVACSDDDEMRPLRASAGGFTFEELNGCDIGGSANATEFAFQIDLDKVPTIEIGGVEFDIDWADGDESNDRFEDDYVISGSTLEFDWCFRFGSLDWFEVTATIVDEDRKPLSNRVTIRVDRPSGAN